MVKQVRINSKSRGLLIIVFLWLILFTGSFVFAQQNNDSQQKYVSIDFNDVDIRVFIKFISELTNENFVIDSRVKGKVNILSPGKITIKEAYRVFESVLEVHGFTTVKAGEVKKIIPMPIARSKNVETLLNKSSKTGEDKIVTQLIPLQYADANDIKKLFAPLISKGSVILAYPPTNTLIITGVFSNIKRLVKIIDAIDVKDVGRQLSIIPIEHANATNLVKTLAILFKKAGQRKSIKKSLEGAIEFVADERTNTIIVMASETNTVKVKKLIAALDEEVPKSDAKIHVYYLENAKAEELSTVLQSLSGKSRTADKKGKKVEPLVSGTVKIAADKATNSLILMADKDDYTVLKAVIQKLDITRPMVYIEALIMEIRMEDSFELGVEWTAAGTANKIHDSPSAVYGGYNNSDISAFPSIDSGSLNLPGGFSMGILTKGITIGDIVFPTLGAAIKALQKDEKVHIISTPQILTTDNEEAQISVGENIPYLTTSGSGDQNYENFEYKDVGVELKITPQISQGRFVRLNIYQKVEKVSSTENATQPTTLKRTAETTVVVKDADTVVIGGLIGEDLSSSNAQVPCFGDVPLVGNLFKSQSKSGIKTNLYIFLTPHIIENPAEAKEIYKEKDRNMKKLQGKTINLYHGASDQKTQPAE